MVASVLPAGAVPAVETSSKASGSTAYSATCVSLSEGRKRSCRYAPSVSEPSTAFTETVTLYVTPAFTGKLWRTPISRPGSLSSIRSALPPFTGTCASVVVVAPPA
jgi:hypothetical protein